MRTSPYTDAESGIEIEICQVRGVQYSSRRRRLQYRDIEYNRYTVTVNNKMNKNHKSVSMSDYKIINNQLISTTLLLLLPVSST